MPRRRDASSPKGVYRTARAGLRLTRGQRRRPIGLLISGRDGWACILVLHGQRPAPDQRRRLIGLLISAGDVWSCILELNGWRRSRQARPLASYQELCRMLAASGPGTIAEAESAGHPAELRRQARAW